MKSRMWKTARTVCEGSQVTASSTRQKNMNEGLISYFGFRIFLFSVPVWNLEYCNLEFVWNLRFVIWNISLICSSVVTT